MSETPEVAGSVAAQMQALRAALDTGWAADTAAYPEMWVPDRPSSGHCLIASLLVQDALGGNIRKGRINGGETHYWNEVDGLSVDLTSDQFDVIVMDEPPTVRRRDDVMTSARTVWRYETLKRRSGLTGTQQPENHGTSDP